MKDVKSLIRLHLWRLDERRVQLRNLEQQLDELKYRLLYIEEGHKHQQEIQTRTLYQEVGVEGPIYGQYVQSYEEKKKEILTQIKDVERQMIILTDEMTVIFQELKKFEITQEIYDIERRDDVNRALQHELDDIGTQMRRRRLN